MRFPSPHKAIIAIVKPLRGPQDIALQLDMSRYHYGTLQARALANIFLFVSEYSF